MHRDEPDPGTGIAIPSWRRLASGLWTPSSLIGVAAPIQQSPHVLGG
jgi:hypothetical protein